MVPADVFPQGLPVAESMAVAQAGTPLPVDAVFSPGQTLGAGIVLDRDVRVEAVSTLAPEYFQNGFSNYEVNGHRGVHVTEGASIDVAMPVYRYRPGMINAVDRDAALEVWTPPLYQALREERRGVRRGGASLTLKSESQRRPGAIAISEGATVQVDPGQSITLSGGQTTVEGTLRAHGGRIDILNPETDGVTQSQSLGESIWIGENALLDASGFAYTATGARGRRYGEVLDGGQVTLGSLAPDELNDNGIYEINNRFIVVRDGAVIDVSGTRADLDLGGDRPTTVASSAGGLAMRSNAGIYFDGELRARAGGEGAAGGDDGGIHRQRVAARIEDAVAEAVQDLIAGQGRSQAHPFGFKTVDLGDQRIGVKAPFLGVADRPCAGDQFGFFRFDPVGRATVRVVAEERYAEKLGAIQICACGANDGLTIARALAQPQAFRTDRQCRSFAREARGLSFVLLLRGRDDGIDGRHRQDADQNGQYDWRDQTF